MVYNTQYYWIFLTLSVVRYSTEHDVSETVPISEILCSKNTGRWTKYKNPVIPKNLFVLQPLIENFNLLTST
jgi:hypothetical protein